MSPTTRMRGSRRVLTGFVSLLVLSVATTPLPACGCDDDSAAAAVAGDAIGSLAAGGGREPSAQGQPLLAAEASGEAAGAPAVGARKDCTESSASGLVADAATAPTVAAAAQPEMEERVEPTVAAAPPAAAGMRVYIDPQTGKFTAPPPGAAGEESGGVPRAGVPDRQFEVVPAPGGGVMVDLKGSFKVYSVATKSPDGKVETECVRGEDAAREAVDETSGAGTATE